MKPEKIYTICVLTKEKNGKKFVCLGEKKRGYFIGKLNGFGGKKNEAETIEDCLKREALEECGVKLINYTKRVLLYIYGFDMTHIIHVYISNEFRGDIVESEEMKPIWFKQEKIPYEKTIAVDIPIWLPIILKDETTKLVGKFYYNEKDEMYDQKITYLKASEEFEDF